MNPELEKTQQEALKEQLAEAKFAELSVEEIEGKQVFVATDETVDREGEIISIDGWQMENFKKNPILLWSHNPYEPMIGRAHNIRMRTIGGKKKMTFEPEFHRKSELSRLIADLVDENWVKTVSVGFRPYERQGNRFTKQEMLEISFVNIPANPEATTLALSKGHSKEVVNKLFTSSTIEKTVDERITELVEEVGGLKSEIKRLEVAQKANPTVDLKSSSGNGRSKSSKKDNIRKLLQIANKSLSKALEMEKHGQN